MRKYKIWLFGLSPRVRGNRLHTWKSRVSLRSIPACAGEPAVARRHYRVPPVYPRVCGGTIQASIAVMPCIGLSPRVRGNLYDAGNTPGQVGSIPACAGEPTWATVGQSLITVYPRVCGGTKALELAGRKVSGLSPRVRGNPFVASVILLLLRSIPACAGEPIRPEPRDAGPTVYPRVCGGTRPIHA